MTIQELSDRIQEISLNHKDINGYYVGNTWDMAASKSSDIYPCVWMEFPVLVTYLIKGEKSLAFSLDVIMLPKQDDVNDELFKISQCEVIADQLIQAYQAKIRDLTVTKMTGLTVKNINADIACGVRVDLEVVTNRACNYQDYFREKMDRM